MALPERVLRFIEREALLPRGTRVAVALSGGADSVALTLVLQDLAAAAGFTVAGLLHLHHGLRAAADEDERFCRRLADRLSLPIRVGRVDVRGLGAAQGISLEHAGHRARYAFFDESLPELEATRVATAHTRDDQAETVLMRLLRGAGPGGLSGIHPRASSAVRPFLDVGRDEVRTFLADRGQTFREDESNRDLGVTRNRVRHELLPYLRRRYSPAVVETLARDATIARRDAGWLEAAANVATSGAVSYREGGALVDCAELRRHPLALVTRVVKQALERVAGRPAGLEQIDRLLEMASVAPALTVTDLPGARVRRVGEQLQIRGDSDAARQQHHRFAYALPIPGAVAVPEAGLVLTSESRPGVPVWPPAGGDREVQVDPRSVSAPLTVRSWRPGDRFRPLGLGGRKKLQDLFVDRKVTRAERRRVPIVTDAEGGIVWVVGHAVGHDFRLTEGRAGVLLLRAQELGGAG